MLSLDGHFQHIQKVGVVLYLVDFLRCHGIPQPGNRVIARQAGSWQLAADRDGKLTLTITGDPAGRAMLRSSARIEPGRWHHIAFSVFGRPHDTSLVRLYLDGELQRIDESLEAVLSSADAIVLGGDEVAPLLGEVRDLRLYLMALTGEEAGRLFAGGAGPAS